MPTGFGSWGVDSTNLASGASPDPNQNFASYVKNRWSTPHQYFGRYFGNSPGRFGNGTAAGMLAECQALVANLFNFIPPVNSPGNVQLDYNTGGLAAQAATADIQTAINQGHMDLPDTANHAVYLYLDIEYGTGISPLSTAYWQGWSDAVRNSFITSPRWGVLKPIYPAAYANPNDGATMNVLVGTLGYTCWGLWTPTPSAVNCDYCAIPGPNIANATGNPSLTMHLWQYGIHETAGKPSSGCPYSDSPSPCGTDYPNVDLDESNPDFVMSNYWLWLFP